METVFLLCLVQIKNAVFKKTFLAECFGWIKDSDGKEERAMTTRSITPATDGQKRSLSTLIQEALDASVRRGELSKEGAQEIILRGGEFKNAVEAALVPILQRFSVPPQIICVPDMPATELTEALKRECRLTYLDPDQARWNFYTGVDGNLISGRGKKYEVIVWKPELLPGEVISSEAVREHFRALDAHGNVGAFTAWLRQVKDPIGYYASIPENNDCWRSPRSLRLFAPCSIFGPDYRKLRQHWFDDGWHGDWSFVGFREIP